MKEHSKKTKRLGQFFTQKNIFHNKVFLKWFKSIPNDKKNNILEPFAGKNGLINMMKELNLIQSFKSFDIEPQSEDVFQNDSINNFPIGFSFCVTNPPFLAKNVASRKDIPITIEPFSDLYEKCLDLCLKNCSYLAAIVPESFIVSPFFKNRVFAIISLTQKYLFDHTEHPVCLALFNPENSNDFIVCRDNKILSNYNESLKNINDWLAPKISYTEHIKFHVPKGNIGLFNIDATNITKQIHFCEGTLIEESEVGYQSRLRTRIMVTTPDGKDLTKRQEKGFIKTCNKVLKEYRHKTQDIFITSFKGLRSDGKYRRRLDYSTSRLIMSKAYYLYFFKVN